MSQLTIHILNFIFLITLFADTHSSVATSFLWVAYALPALLVGPFTAVLTDIVSKKRMLQVSNLLQAITIFVFGSLGYTTLFTLYSVTFIYSFLNQFYVPAEMASIPSIINKNKYSLANGIFFFTQQIAIIFGFTFAGLILARFGFQNALYLCSIFMAIAFAATSFLPALKPESKANKYFEKSFISFFVDIYEGYLFIKSETKIIIPMLLLIALQVSLAVVVINTPAIATDIFNIAEESVGFYIILPAGLGALSAAIAVPRILLRFRKIKLINASLFIASLFFIALGILSILPSTYKFILGFVSTLALGFTFVGMMIPAQTYLQQVTPGGFRGRVFGNFWFLVTFATLLPVIFSGIIVEALGANILITVFGVLTFSLFLFMRKYAVSLIKVGFRK